MVDWTGAYIAALPGDIVRKFLVCDELLKVPAVLLHVVHAHLTGQFVHLLVAVDLICNGPEHAVAVCSDDFDPQACIWDRAVTDRPTGALASWPI